MICLLSDFFLFFFSNNIVPRKKCGNGLKNSNNNMRVLFFTGHFFTHTRLSHCNYFMTFVKMNFIMNKTLAAV